MKITLIRTGGLLSVKKKAEDEVNWTIADLEQLKNAVQPATLQPGDARDNVTYLLQCGKENFPVEWHKIPAKFSEVLEKLKSKLVIEKF